MRTYLDEATKRKKSQWTDFVEEGPKTSEVCERMLVKAPTSIHPVQAACGILRDWRRKDGLFLHLEDPQEPTRINTTQPTPHHI
ncbi:hypothetical protein C4D60_Mb02t16390 [Musa balbisiana]|uniref:Uncharacterized protein n=1 Tax=Musa balbisiana TaxID=52838 RepID=A0A4S8IB94_MUSBA|nr:hypothetical protein C4D60_Mb02t16390 [Musa balbisiana]